MTIRQLTENDWEAMGWLLSESFMRGIPRRATIPDDHRATFGLAMRLGAFEGAELVAMLTVLDIGVHWHGGICRMGGIAGVCCKVAARGRGHVGALMTESLRLMRDWGQPISGLYPFSHAFYRRHGWESVVQRLEFTVPVKSIPNYPEGRNVQTSIGFEALNVIKPIYDRYAARLAGMTTRTNEIMKWWDALLSASGDQATYVQAYVEPMSGEPEGYFTMRLPEPGKPAILGEFVTLSAAALRGLLDTLHHYGTQLDTVIWNAPPDHPLPLHISEHDVQTALQRPFMGRIVNVEAALSLLRIEGNGSANVRVHDDGAAWNDRTFRIRAEEGRVVASPEQEATPQCEVDIRALALACWGAYSLSDLRDAGRVAVADEAAFRFLARLLPQRIPAIFDAF